MRDLVLVVLLLAIGFMWLKLDAAKEAAEAARAEAATARALVEVDRSHDARVNQLEKGGTDEALTDYGRDAAGILWGGN